MAATKSNGIQEIRLEQAVRNGFVYGRQVDTLVAVDIGGGLGLPVALRGMQ